MKEFRTQHPKVTRKSKSTSVTPSLTQESSSSTAPSINKSRNSSDISPGIPTQSRPASNDSLPVPTKRLRVESSPELNRQGSDPQIGWYQGDFSGYVPSIQDSSMLFSLLNSRFYSSIVRDRTGITSSDSSASSSAVFS